MLCYILFILYLYSIYILFIFYLYWKILHIYLCFCSGETSMGRISSIRFWTKIFKSSPNGPGKHPKTGFICPGSWGSLGIVPTSWSSVPETFLSQFGHVWRQTLSVLRLQPLPETSSGQDFPVWCHPTLGLQTPKPLKAKMRMFSDFRSKIQCIIYLYRIK